MGELNDCKARIRATIRIVLNFHYSRPTGKEFTPLYT